MCARGDLGHNTAERRVEIELRAHQIGKDDAVAARLTPHQRGSSLIAARLDAENHEVALWAFSHDASLQGKAGAIEEIATRPCVSHL
jgi:hypothetical protein